MTTGPTEPARRRRGRPPSTTRTDAEALPRVEAVDRALAILEAFADGTQKLALADLSARTGYYPSTILRLSGSLARAGYIQRDGDGMFRLGPSLLRLGVLYRNGFDLADYVRPALARLVERTGETATFFIREGDQRVCLYRHHSPRLIRHHVEEGGRLPLDRGAAGHVLSAFTGGVGERLDAVRAEGLSVSLGERDPEIAAVAAPVFGRGGRFLGALGVSGPKSRFGQAALDGLSEAMLGEAAALSRALGG